MKIAIRCIVVNIGAVLSASVGSTASTFAISHPTNRLSGRFFGVPQFEHGEQSGHLT